MGAKQRFGLALRRDVTAGQDVSEVELGELLEIVVSVLPCAGLQVGGEGVHGALDCVWRDKAEHGDPGSNCWVEVGVRAPPIGAIEAVSAVVWDQNGLKLNWPEVVVESLFPGSLAAVMGRDEVEELGQVLGREPEALGLGGIGVEQDDAMSGDSFELSETLIAVGPVVVADERHRDIEAVVGERQLFGRRLHGFRGTGSALGDHHSRWFDGDDVSVDRLVSTSSRADVQHALGVAECLSDRGRDSRIGPPDSRVSDSEPVVEHAVRILSDHVIGVTPKPSFERSLGCASAGNRPTAGRRSQPMRWPW